MAPGAQAATFLVTKTADTNDGICDADCSLREAIITANASIGVADVITVPAGIYTLTIPGSLEDLAATGDLDIRDTVTINGAGPALTIIQAGTTNANGIDKVFSVNQTATTLASATFNGVTVRFGRNTNILDLVNFSHLGAGIDFFGSSGTTTACGTEKLTITNSVITENSVDNSASAGVGAGVSADNGHLEITNSTINNNQTTNQPGGGISHHGGGCTLTMSDSNVSGNQAKGGSNGEGGGIFVRQNNNGTVAIHNSIISNNTSESRGGGIKLESTPGPLTTTIDQATRIIGNTSLGTGAGISEGGGLDISALGASTATLKDVTITNNHADDPADGGGKGGGIFHNLGTLNVSLSRITGNTAPTGSATGSGLFVNGGTVTAENNWWGCDALPPSVTVTGSCDSVSGTADVDPRLDLVVTATPATIVSGGTSSVLVDLSKNSNGAAVLPVVLNGLPIAFGADFGTMSPTSAPLAAFMATSTYTNTSCPGPATAMAALDNGTDTASITITCATTTTTTTSTTTTTEPTTTTTTEPTTTTTEPTTTTTTEPTTTTTEPTTTTTTTTTTMPPPVTCDGFGPTTGCTVNGVRNQVCRGTPGNDTITGTNGSDVIVGLGGNDIINGGNSDDRICGGEDNDTLNGNNGIDRLFGDNGTDTLNGNSGNDALDGGAATDTCNGGNGTDTAAACESVTSVP